jgi:hypothetical protein
MVLFTWRSGSWQAYQRPNSWDVEALGGNLEDAEMRSACCLCKYGLLDPRVQLHIPVFSSTADLFAAASMKLRARSRTEPSLDEGWVWSCCPNQADSGFRWHPTTCSTGN